MELTKKEKELIVETLKTHLEWVHEQEKLPEPYLKWVAAEAEYDAFVENIIEKLK